MSATNETRTYWYWSEHLRKFVKELEEGEISEEPQLSPGPEESGEEPGEEPGEDCVHCEGRGFLALGYDDVKDCDYCGGCGAVQDDGAAWGRKGRRGALRTRRWP